MVPSIQGALNTQTQRWIRSKILNNIPQSRQRHTRRKGLETKATGQQSSTLFIVGETDKNIQNLLSRRLQKLNQSEDSVWKLKLKLAGKLQSTSV